MNLQPEGEGRRADARGVERWTRAEVFPCWDASARIQIQGRDLAETSDCGCPAGVTSTDWAFSLFDLLKGRLAAGRSRQSPVPAARPCGVFSSARLAAKVLGGPHPSPHLCALRVLLPHCLR